MHVIFIFSVVDDYFYDTDLTNPVRDLNNRLLTRIEVNER